MENNHTKERLPWLDLTRSMAIIGVIMCHVIGDIYGFTMQSMQAEGLFARIFAFSANVTTSFIPFWQGKPHFYHCLFCSFIV